MNRRSLLWIVAASLVPLACALPSLTTPTPVEPTSLPPTAASPTDLPSGSGACQPTATAAFDVYARPSLMADVFGSLAPGFPPLSITGLTADGWLGFDPGVAQAANIGVFRLRWIPPGAPVTLSGDCASVPIEPWVPAPGVCYQMSMGPVDVFPVPDSGVASAGVLDVGDFAAVDARTATGWLLVNGLRANTPDVFGYIMGAVANLNGSCDTLPEITN